MTLETFRSICMHRGITLDEGYSLYNMYRTAFVGQPKNLNQESLSKIMEKNLYSNGHVSEDLKNEFKIAEMEFGDGSQYTETILLNEKMLRITQPVKRRELAVIPILDTLMSGLYQILVTDKIKKTILYRSLFDRVKLYFNNDLELVVYYMTWYYLWPTSGANNDTWEQLFMTPYANVNLRSCTDNKLRDFKDLARKKDIRIFILSTYVFIKSGIKENGQAYIQKYENFKGVQEEWFLFTIDIIEELREDLPSLFDRNFMLSSRRQKFTNSATGTLV